MTFEGNVSGIKIASRDKKQTQIHTWTISTYDSGNACALRTAHISQAIHGPGIPLCECPLNDS